MKQNKLSTQLTEVLQQDIDGTVNLWPAIRTRIEVPKTQSRRIPRIAWAAAIALIALLGVTSVAVALSLTERAAAVDPGINVVYQAGLITPVNQTQKVGDIAVTLDWVYADPLRVLVAYSTDAGQKEHFRPGVSLESLSLVDGTQLHQIGGTGYVETNTQMSEIAALLTPTLAQGATTLDARIALSVSDQSALLNAENGNGAKVDRSEGLGTLYFDVHIPLTAGRVFSPNQEVIAEGRTVRLGRMIVAPTGVRADICFDIPDADAYDWQIVGEAQGGSQKIDSMTSAPIDGSPICQAVIFWDPLPLDATSYTMRMTEIIGFPKAPPDGELWRIPGSWVFDVNGN